MKPDQSHFTHITLLRRMQLYVCTNCPFLLPQALMKEIEDRAESAAEYVLCIYASIWQLQCINFAFSHYKMGVVT